MKKSLIQLGIAVLLIVFIWAGNLVWKNFRGAGPAIRGPSLDITKQIPNQPESGNYPLPVTGGCVVSGCSGQLCMEATDAENQGITTCEMRPEYQCYKDFGQCKRQTNSLCGWSLTEELQSCLAKY